MVSLIADGTLELATPARSLLGDDLPLIRDDVTIEHLLGHRSGIGDYLDENVELDINAYLMPVPVHELATTESYLAVLDGHVTKFPPDERFEYCNGGYVVLALIAERASGVPFHELVVQRVRTRRHAGLGVPPLRRTARSNRARVPPDRRRVENERLPPTGEEGSGDGGIYTTVADVRALWSALFAGEIVSPDWVREMVRPQSDAGTKRYGLGFGSTRRPTR